MFPRWVKFLKSWKAEEKPTYEEGRYVWRVYLEGVRQRRLAGILEFKEDAREEIHKLPQELIEGLIKLFSDSNALSGERWEEFCKKWASRLSLNDDFIMKSSFDLGLVGRFTRFKADEKSIHSVTYGPMDALTALCNKKAKEIVESNQKWLNKMKREIKSVTLKEDENGHKGQALSIIRNFVLDKISQIEELSAEEHPVKIHDKLTWTFAWDKPRSKFHLAMEFLLAVIKAVNRYPDGFEWKELGPQIDDSIGGSKRFDKDAEKLLSLVEDITDLPLEDLGLTSRGSLYPLYILGSLELTTDIASRTLSDSIHAITNLEIERLDNVRISAKRIILTENRALLIKMYKTGWYRKDPKSLVIGIDGRLRLAHRRFLKLLRDSSPSVPCFIWTDSDSSGISFIKDLHDIFPESRIVLMDEKSLKVLAFKDFLVEIKENPRLLNREQESFLGGPLEWDELFDIKN